VLTGHLLVAGIEHKQGDSNQYGEKLNPFHFLKKLKINYLYHFKKARREPEGRDASLPALRFHRNLTFFVEVEELGQPDGPAE
ncbi:MAG TPA: hypothetical protein PKH43_03805, partial [Saprospiraceae bacterium]|nr:hypothetical protein [Saprospiraceae bacterium]